MEKISYIKLTAFLKNIHSQEERDTEEGPIHAEIIYKLGTESSLCQVPDRSCVSASSSTYTICYTNRGNQKVGGHRRVILVLYAKVDSGNKQINSCHNCNESDRQVETRLG